MNELLLGYLPLRVSSYSPVLMFVGCWTVSSGMALGS